MQIEHNDKIWTTNFNFLFVTNFFIFLTYYALITALPIFVLDQLHGTETQAGLIVTVFLLSAIIIRPFSGNILELFGRKKLLLISLVFFGIATLLNLWTTNYFALIALRFFHGIWFSIITTATGAIAADIIPNKKRGEGLGYFMMSTNIAIVAGPFCAISLIQATTFQALFLILSLLMVGAILLSIFIHIPATEIKRHTNRKKLRFDDLFEKKSLPISFLAGVLAFAYSSVLSFITIFSKSLGLIEAASYFFVVFAISMLISRPFVGRLFDTKGPSFVVYPTLVLFVLGLIVLTYTNSAFLLWLSAVLIGVGYGSLMPCFQTLAIQFADRNRSGHATATFFTLFDLGLALGAYFLGMIVTNFGYRPLYFVASLFVILLIILFKPVMKRSQDHINETYQESTIEIPIK